MIKQVSGLNVNSITKRPKPSIQGIMRRNRSNITYTHNYKYKYDSVYERQQKNALWTSVSIVLGALLFTMGYFMLSSMKKVKP